MTDGDVVIMDGGDIIGQALERGIVDEFRVHLTPMVLGGGTPKNFINQASVQAEFYSPLVGGHRYALQIVTDVPHFGAFAAWQAKSSLIGGVRVG